MYNLKDSLCFFWNIKGTPNGAFDGLMKRTSNNSFNYFLNPSSMGMPFYKEVLLKLSSLSPSLYGDQSPFLATRIWRVYLASHPRTSLRHFLISGGTIPSTFSLNTVSTST